MTKRQNFCLQQCSRPEQSDQRQPNQAATISHQPRASPDSTALTSRMEFPTMTPAQPLKKPSDGSDGSAARRPLMLGSSGNVDGTGSRQTADQSANSGAGVPGRADICIFQHGVTKSAHTAVWRSF